MGNDTIFDIQDAVVKFHGERKVKMYSSKIDYLRSLTKAFAKVKLDPLVFRGKDQVLNRIRMRLNPLDSQVVSVIQAVINGHKSSLQLYLYRVREVPDRDSGGRTLFHHAAAMGYEWVIIRILHELKCYEDHIEYKKRFKSSWIGRMIEAGLPCITPQQEDSALSMPFF